MKKIILSLLLIFVATPISWGGDEINSSILLSSPSIVTITGVDSAAATGFINASNGHISMPRVTFKINSNSNEKTQFILSAKVKDANGKLQDAYGINKTIILGNESSGVNPTFEAIENAKSSHPEAKLNKNVIAYPVSNVLEGLEGGDLVYSATQHGSVYNLRLKPDTSSGKIVQTLGQVPANGSYSLSDDAPGLYKAYVTLSILRE